MDQFDDTPDKQPDSDNSAGAAGGDPSRPSSGGAPNQGGSPQWQQPAGPGGPQGPAGPAGPYRQPYRPLPGNAPHYQYSYGQPPRKKGGFLRVLFILAFVGSVGLNVLLLLAIAAMGVGMSQVDNYDVELVEGDMLAGQSILLVDVSGVLIESEGSLLGPGGRVSSIMEQLVYAERAEEVVGVLLVVDSPGGGVTSSDLLYRQVLRAKQAGKPVVAYVKGRGASGAYYVSAPSDYIVSSPTSLVGSIGVIIRTYNFAEAADKLGIDSVAVTSGEHKNLLDPLKKVEKTELAILQKLVDSMHRRFVSIVKQGRGLTDVEADRIDDGRVFTPEESVALKLIDEVGYRDVALAKLRSLSGGGGARVIRLKRRMGFFDLMQQRQERAASMDKAMSDLSTTLVDLQQPRVLYMWDPAL